MSEEESDEITLEELDERISTIEETIPLLKIKSQVQQVIYDGQSKLEEFQKTVESKILSIQNQLNIKLDELSKQIEKAEDYEKKFIDRIDETYESEEETIAGIETLKKEIQGVLEDVEKSQEKINGFYNRCFSETENEDGAISKSIEEEIENLKESLGNLIEDSKKRINEQIQERNSQIGIEQGTQVQLFEKFKVDAEKSLQDNEENYKEMYNRIQGLLPGAGTAGLAISYRESKERYGFSPVKWNDKKETFYPSTWKSICNGFKFLVYYSLFIFPLVGVVWYNIWTASNVFTWADLMRRMIIDAPLIVISIFGIYSILSSRKMYEAYNHKQRVMEMYTAFSEKITEEEELNETLITIVLDTIKKDPHLNMKDKIFDPKALIQPISTDK